MKQARRIYGFAFLLAINTLLLACGGEVFSGGSKEGAYWCQSSNKLFRDNFCGKEGDCPDGWTFFDIQSFTSIKQFPESEVCCIDKSNGNEFLFAGEQCPSQFMNVQVSSSSCAFDETQACYQKLLDGFRGN